MYDLIVIGGGPAGMMAAIRAAERKKRVLLVEQNKELGKKLRLTGGGRCNVTNLKDDQAFIESLPNINRRFMYSPLKQFNAWSIYYYFLGLGISLKEEDHNRIFPESNDSNEIVNALLNELNRLKVSINTECQVLTVSKNEFFTVETTRGTYKSTNVLISTGGKSMPSTGSKGDGFLFAKHFNHEITPLYPTETPITSKDPLINSQILKGLSLYDVVGRIVSDKQVLDEKRYDLLFAHFGLTGPLALKLSQTVFLNLEKPLDFILDPLPDSTEEEIMKKVLEQVDANPKKQLKNIDLNIPSRLKEALLTTLGIDATKPLHTQSKNDWTTLVHELKNIKIGITGVKSFETSFVTGGGVSLDTINPKTMESKLVSGLYFAGEVLDLHGHTGGYNITIAFSTGFSCGEHIQ